MHDHKGPALIQISGLEPKPSIPKPTQKPSDHVTKFLVGLDVGSTTVKAIVVDAATDQILWQDYQRHETKQPEKTLEFLKRIEAETGDLPSRTSAGCLRVQFFSLPARKQRAAGRTRPTGWHRPG